VYVIRAICTAVVRGEKKMEGFLYLVGIEHPGLFKAPFHIDGSSRLRLLPSYDPTRLRDRNRMSPSGDDIKSRHCRTTALSESRYFLPFFPSINFTFS
jgi:hypothetical protein